MTVVESAAKTATGAAGTGSIGQMVVAVAAAAAVESEAKT